MASSMIASGRSTIAHTTVARAQVSSASKARVVARSASVSSRAFLGNTKGMTRTGFSCTTSSAMSVVMIAEFADTKPCTGEEYVVVGLAHCFEKVENKLVARMVIEPVTAGTIESMAAGALTSYMAVTAVNMDVVAKMDLSILPKRFQDEPGVTFAESFVFRAECASRTWARPHAVENLLNVVPANPEIRDDWNYSVQNNTRILNFENVVDDNDNVKQDMSIDVYGRKEEGVDIDKQIEESANA